jgi:polyhydroxybutyrate depolymerase
MAMRIACAHPDAIRAIAVVATKVLLDAPCENPDDPVPAVFFFGTADELNPHAGRKDASHRRDAVLGLSHSAEESLAIWSGRNRCGAREPAQMINLADDGVTVRRYDWGSCAAALRYFETEGGGHAWPGARARRTILPRQTPEAVVRDIDAGQESLRFFMGL